MPMLAPFDRSHDSCELVENFRGHGFRPSMNAAMLPWV